MPRHDARNKVQFELGQDWRPAREADGFEKLTSGVDLFVACIKEAVSQLAEDRNVPDKRVELATALGTAFTLHAKPYSDYSFLNQSIARYLQDGANDDTWDSVVSVYTTLAARLQSRRASTNDTPVVCFVRYRGANRQHHAAFQLWVREIQPVDGQPSYPPFVLSGPIRPSSGFEPPPESTSNRDASSDFGNYSPSSSRFSSESMNNSPTNQEESGSGESKDMGSKSEPDPQAPNESSQAKGSENAASDPNQKPKEEPTKPRPEPKSSNDAIFRELSKGVLNGIGLLGARVVGYVIAASLLYQVGIALLGNTFFQISTLIGNLTDSITSWSIR